MFPGELVRGIGSELSYPPLLRDSETMDRWSTSSFSRAEWSVKQQRTSRRVAKVRLQLSYRLELVDIQMTNNT